MTTAELQELSGQLYADRQSHHAGRERRKTAFPVIQHKTAWLQLMTWHIHVLFAHCDIRPSICETWTLCFADWTVGLLRRQRRYTSDISVGPLDKLVCLLIVCLDSDGWRRGYSDKSHELSVSVFGRKWIVTFGVISVSAESRILISAWLSVSAETEIPLSVDLYCWLLYHNQTLGHILVLEILVVAYHIIRIIYYAVLCLGWFSCAPWMYSEIENVGVIMFLVSWAFLVCGLVASYGSTNVQLSYHGMVCKMAVLGCQVVTSSESRIWWRSIRLFLLNLLDTSRELEQCVGRAIRWWRKDTLLVTR